MPAQILTNDGTYDSISSILFQSPASAWWMDGSNARTHIHIHSFVRSFPSTLESLHPTDRPSLGTCNHATFNIQQEDEMSIKVHITGNGVQSINPIRDISFNENGNKENYRTFQPSNNDQWPTTNDQRCRKRRNKHSTFTPNHEIEWNHTVRYLRCRNKKKMTEQCLVLECFVSDTQPNPSRRRWFSLNCITYDTVRYYQMMGLMLCFYSLL